MSAARELNKLAEANTSVLASARAPRRWRNDAEHESAGLSILRRASAWLDSLCAINPLMPDGPLWGDCLSQLVLQHTRTNAASAVPHRPSRPQRTEQSHGGGRRNSVETGSLTRADVKHGGSRMSRPARPRRAPYPEAQPRPDLRAHPDFARPDASTLDALPINHRRAHRDARRAEDGGERQARPNDVSELPLRADLPLLAQLYRQPGTTRSAERSQSSPNTSLSQRSRNAAPSLRAAHASGDFQLPSRAPFHRPLAPQIDVNARRSRVATHNSSSRPDARHDWQIAVSGRIARAFDGVVPLAVASHAEGQPSSQAQWSQTQWAWLLAGPSASRQLLGRLALLTRADHTTPRDADARTNVTNADAGTLGEMSARRLAPAHFDAPPFSPNEHNFRPVPNQSAVNVETFPGAHAEPDAARSAFSSLPPLLPGSASGATAPGVASAVARQGALSEALSPDEDLDALADKIKLILDEQARRHGIDV